ncbi:EF-hand domain-containing protein [Flavimaricola marinus]|uniref:EF hand n=1 Tax=Flavimaricola marinus TaxID=1819565 RepID=A0A238LIH2_9RHOB|nr:EF-hand domain-containing protein [Flavimaricola marinus]SMY08756.1 EF hand [Flavimaricola marinus]
MKTTLLMSAIVAGLFVTAVDAQERGVGGPNGPDLEFSTLDSNADGMLTPEDLVALQAERFAAADTDGDGALSEAELIARATADATERMLERATERASRMIDRLDANDDGLLQADEMNAGPEQGMERMFARFDTDEDGAISEEEFAAALEKMADRRGDRDGRRDGEGRRHHGGGDHGPRNRG